MVFVDFQAVKRKKKILEKPLIVTIPEKEIVAADI
jgi:hypothetical protein